MAKLLSLFALILASCCLARAEAPPRYFGASPDALAAVKARLAAGDKSLQPALKKLVKDADEALKIPPRSVMEKKRSRNCRRGRMTS